MAAHSGKGSANGSGANPALDTDAADELAANFRPSWAADDDDDLPPGMAKTAPAAEAPPAPAAPATAAVSIAPVVTISNDAPAVTSTAEAAVAAAPPAPAAPQTQKMLSPQTVIGMGSPVRAPEPSSEALDSQNVIEVAPAKSLSTTQPMNQSARAPLSQGPGPSSRGPGSAGPASVGTASAKPVTRNVVRPASAVDPFKASALDSDEFPPLKKSNKGLIFGVVGVAIAVGLGLFLKFALSPDEPAKTTTLPATTTATAKENDIPPPPPKEETPPAVTATATPPPTVVKAEPPPAADPPKKADPPPVQKSPDPPRTVAAAPAKPPKQPPSSPPTTPKTPPKSTGGGIVRDSPF
jgi:hypothetical protein